MRILKDKRLIARRKPRDDRWERLYAAMPLFANPLYIPMGAKICCPGELACHGGRPHMKPTHTRCGPSHRETLDANKPGKQASCWPAAKITFTAAVAGRRRGAAVGLHVDGRRWRGNGVRCSREREGRHTPITGTSSSSRGGRRRASCGAGHTDGTNAHSLGRPTTEARPLLLRGAGGASRCLDGAAASPEQAVVSPTRAPRSSLGRRRRPPIGRKQRCR